MARCSVLVSVVTLAQVADDEGHRNSSMLSMNWVAVNIQTANEEHRISKPEYVHVWVSPGRWFNMPQVCLSARACLAVWVLDVCIICAAAVDSPLSARPPFHWKKTAQISCHRHLQMSFLAPLSPLWPRAAAVRTSAGTPSSIFPPFKLCNIC